jgi:thioredoxin-related protein
MKIIAAIVIPFMLLSHTGWLTDFNEAQKTATQKHQLIVLNFSGSDWCGPCIRLRKEIFNSEAFSNFADSNLVLISADFPRSSKNKLSDEQEKKNDALADKYNADGKFPYTLLLSADGKIIKTWDGFPNVSPDEFVREVRVISNQYK